MPDSLEEHQILSLLSDKKQSPLYEKLKKEDKQFLRLRKIALVDFVQTIPSNEEVDTLEDILSEDDENKKPSGKVISNKEFDVLDALADEKPKGSKSK